MAKKQEVPTFRQAQSSTGAHSDPEQSRTDQGRPEQSRRAKSFLTSIRDLLTAQEKRWASVKKRLAKESLTARPEIGSIRSPEFVEEATEGMNQERLETEQGILEKLLMETRLALAKMKIGKYGICENCGQPIERSRLKVYPQARYGLDCEKKLSLKKGA